MAVTESRGPQRGGVQLGSPFCQAKGTERLAPRHRPQKEIFLGLVAEAENRHVAY
jgi:hypothetical protein